MKITARELPQLLRQPPESLRVALFFGPDAGLARQRANRLAQRIAGNEDPMRQRHLAAKDATGEAIARELGQPLLGGGLVALTLAAPFPAHISRKLPAALRALLRLPALQGVAIILGGDMPPSNPVRKLAEKEPAMAAIGCYPDTPAMLARLIQTRVKQAGFSMTQEVLAFLVERLGTDRGISEQELAKLMLYKGGSAGEISLAEVEAVLAPPELAAGDEIAEAAALGRSDALLKAFANARAAGLAPGAWVEQSAFYFRRLHRLAALLAEGGTFTQSVRLLRPPVHFSKLAGLEAATRLWGPQAAAQAFRALAQTAASLRQGAPNAVSEQVLLLLARQAQGRN